jgi:hypothetical protein
MLAVRIRLGTLGPSFELRVVVSKLRSAAWLLVGSVRDHWTLGGWRNWQTCTVRAFRNRAFLPYPTRRRAKRVPLSAGDCNTGLVGCLLIVRELEGVDAGSTSVVGGAGGGPAGDRIGPQPDRGREGSWPSGLNRGAGGRT